MRACRVRAPAVLDDRGPRRRPRFITTAGWSWCVEVGWKVGDLVGVDAARVPRSEGGGLVAWVADR